MKVLIFHSTRDVILAEKTLRADKIACRVIPVPRSVSPLCGMALELKDELLETAGGAIILMNVEFTVFDRQNVTL